MKKLFFAALFIAIVGFAYYTISPLWRNIEMDEASPLMTREPTFVEDPGAGNGQAMTDGVRARADLVAKAHEVEGNVQLIKAGDEHYIRFEDLKTINGPDLKIYLASDTTADDFIDLGSIKATEGNVNYTVPEGTDFEKYDTVLIWCKAFSVLFSYAEFTEITEPRF
jgi:hypothetical protein